MSVLLEPHHIPAAENSRQSNSTPQIKVDPAQYEAGRQGSSSKNVLKSVKSNYAINLLSCPIQSNPNAMT